MDLIGVVYCGGCNPRIDRSGLVQQIEKILPPGCRLATDRPSDQWERAILVCGCPVACANRPDIRSLARRWVLVGGPMIDLECASEDKMAGAVVRKIQELKMKEL